MKYTAEEVRAIAKRLHDDITVADGDALMASDMLTAYAERIKAGEGAVPCPRCNGAGEYMNYRGNMSEMEWCHVCEGIGKRSSPAQAAQVDKPPRLGGCCCGEPCTLGVVHRIDGPCFHYAEPPAEPAAQGEVPLPFSPYLVSEWKAPTERHSWTTYTEQQMRAFAAACLAAQPRVVPDGWVLVPREPTPKMLAAVAGMEISVRIAEDDTAEYPVPEDDCAEIYRNMLAAAPSPGESA